MSFTRIFAAIKLALTSSIHISPLIVGYMFLMLGISIIISEWTTDRMLHQHQLFFDDLINSQQTVPTSLAQIPSYYVSLADKTSSFNAMGILISIIGIIFFGVGIAIMLLTANKIKEYYSFVGSLTFNISNNSLIVIFSTFFAISLLFASVSEQSSDDIKQMFFQIITTSIQENKSVDTISPLLEKYLSQNAFEYALNIFHSVFFSLLSFTFLVVFLLKRTQRMIPIALIDGLVFCSIIAFGLWIIFYILTVGITGSPQIPNMNTEIPFSNNE